MGVIGHYYYYFIRYKYFMLNLYPDSGELGDFLIQVTPKTFWKGFPGNCMSDRPNTYLLISVVQNPTYFMGPRIWGGMLLSSRYLIGRGIFSPISVILFTLRKASISDWFLENIIWNVEFSHLMPEYA